MIPSHADRRYSSVYMPNRGFRNGDMFHFYQNYWRFVLQDPERTFTQHLDSFKYWQHQLSYVFSEKVALLTLTGRKKGVLWNTIHNHSLLSKLDGGGQMSRTNYIYGKKEKIGRKNKKMSIVSPSSRRGGRSVCMEKWKKIEQVCTG